MSIEIALAENYENEKSFRNLSSTRADTVNSS